MTKSLLILAGAIAAALLSSSCATVQGIGKDVERLGQGVQQIR